MKSEIMEQSIKLFEKKGFAETSIQDIVDALGVTKGTFYYYFKSKEELLMDIHRSYIEELLRWQEDILEDKHKNCKSKLREIIALIIRKIRTHRSHASIFFRELRNLNDDHLDEVLAKRDQFRFSLQKLIEEGVQRGEFRQDLRPDIVVFAVLGMCNWSYSWYNPEGEVSEEELTQIYVKLILNGLENPLVDRNEH
ncbi:transcriptional regulator, TetR family [Caldalkalibacillus thermarum TA2.A1]|uniref:TetR/AcrR family transcriptional regulator n=2 Tax=Caldalkalibacillus TaxID=379065 RepID=F5L6H5_CALTT|nr:MULTISPECIES: TetR/AcrR family transcriptional regulator [Caldalkalibacillus]EGL83036.1 transcriptional regulator, TetR family [Caldalkalibacillus thermarum TA2.A1]MDQ0340902.1 AcrR family transcriptional regulator [Caldalkalibacillus uzonensis]QZT33570.1 TetR/AcrR family transcriptional regulator [Caldalkalibacillus thermarum TA2.A1]